MTTPIQGVFARWAGRQRLFGFIDGDDSNEYFIHSSEFRKHGTKLPEPSDRLAFTPDHGPKGHFATEPSYVT